MKLTYFVPAISFAVSATACAQEPRPPTHNFACPVKHATSRVDTQALNKVHSALQTKFAAALGPDAGKVGLSNVRTKLEMTRVDDGKMAALAKLSGCAALMDVESGCAMYFDPELGDPLSAFMVMKKSAPLRKQFEEAIAHVPDMEQRRAAQTCIKLVGGTQ